MFGWVWWPCCSSHKDAPIQSSQLRRGRTVHQEFSSSTATQLSSHIHVLSWSENWSVYQSVSLARSWLFLAVRAGEHNFFKSSSSTLAWSWCQSSGRQQPRHLPVMRWQASYSSRSRTSRIRYGQESSTGGREDRDGGWLTSISPIPLVTLNTSPTPDKHNLSLHTS